MPLNVKRFGASFLLIFILATLVFAQDDVMRQRIARARAYVAVKNYNAAVYELDGIRRESKDETVQSVALTMLISCYLEQGDYRRSQDLLIESFNNQKITKKPSSTYYSVAGQVVRGSRNQIERYRQLGLSLNDRNLPIEAVADLEKMRETLELIIKQSEELGDAKKQPAESFAMVEEASTARNTMARDDFDSTRWKTKIADTRERMANGNAKVINVVEEAPKPTPDPNAVAMVTPTPQTQPTMVPVSNVKTNPKDKKDKNTKPVVQPTPRVQIPNNVAQTEPKIEPTPTPKVEIIPTVAKVEPTPIPVRVEPKIEPTPEPKIETKTITDPLSTPLVTNGGTIETPKNNGETVAKTETTPPIEKTVVENTIITTPSTLDIGSLIGYATQTVKPNYPAIAKQMRLAGIVRVSITLNENGEIDAAESVSGPSMLKRPASDAAKRWKFRPVTKDGQPVKATGFIDFNFAP